MATQASIIPAPILSNAVTMSSRERAEIEACIERLLAILDAADGDCDLGPEEDCGADDLGELDRGASPLAPVYGIDQTVSPINMQAIMVAHEALESGRRGYHLAQTIAMQGRAA